MDNSTGTPVYKYLDDEDYYASPSSRPKRGATARKDHLWPEGVVVCSFYTDLTGKMRIYVANCYNFWLAEVNKANH